MPVTDPKLEQHFQLIAREARRCQRVASDLDYGIDKLAQDDETIEALADLALQMATQSMMLVDAIKDFRRAQ